MAFSLEARTIYAHEQASCLRVPASSVLAFFLPRRAPLTGSWGRAAGEKECPSRRTLHSAPRLLLAKPVVGWRLVRTERKTPGQPSIRVTTATAATTLYLVRSKRPERQIQSPPIERTAPLQATRRHNGDSLRRASLTSFAAVASFLRSSLLLVHLGPIHHTAAACLA